MQVTVNLPDELFERLSRLAEAKNSTLDDVLREAAEMYLAKSRGTFPPPLDLGGDFLNLEDSQEALAIEDKILGRGDYAPDEPTP